MPARRAAEVERSRTGRPSSSSAPRGQRQLAEQRPGELDLAAAHEAVDAGDLARAQRDREMVERAPEAARRAPTAPPAGCRRRRGRRPRPCAARPSGGRSCGRSPRPCRALAASSVMTLCPLRNTVTRSEIASTSSRKCEMKTMLRPSPFSRRSTANSRATSGGDSAEVGSSRIRMRAPENSTRLSSTSCCRPTGSAPMRVRGSMSSPRLAISRFASAFIRAQSTVPSGVSGCAPRNTFSATVRSDDHRQLLVDHADAARRARRAASAAAPRARRSASRPRSRCARRR